MLCNKKQTMEFDGDRKSSKNRLSIVSTSNLPFVSSIHVEWIILAGFKKLSLLLFRPLGRIQNSNQSQLGRVCRYCQHHEKSSSLAFLKMIRSGKEEKRVKFVIYEKPTRGTVCDANKLFIVSWRLHLVRAKKIQQTQNHFAFNSFCISTDTSPGPVFIRQNGLRRAISSPTNKTKIICNFPHTYSLARLSWCERARPNDERTRNENNLFVARFRSELYMCAFGVHSTSGGREEWPIITLKGFSGKNVMIVGWMIETQKKIVIQRGDCWGLASVADSVELY